MEGEVVGVLSEIDPASLSLRDELLFHHGMANSAALWIGRMASYTPSMPSGGAHAKVLLPEFGIEGIAASFWDAAQRVAEISVEWSEVSNIAALSFAAGADAIGERWERGMEASYVVTTAVTAGRIRRFHEAVLAAHKEYGESIPEIVAGHLEECVEDYSSSRIAEWIGNVECDDLFGVIDREVAGALSWAEKHLTPYYATVPETPRETRQSTASRGQTVSIAEVVATLSQHHAQLDAPALTGTQIAADSKASTSTVSRAIKAVFGDGGQNAYVAACDRGDVLAKLAKYEGDGKAFGVADPRELDR